MNDRATVGDRKFTVHAIKCDINGRVYVGCTSDVQRRVYQHFIALKNQAKTKRSTVNGIISGESWQEDYNRYGEEAFSVYVLESDIPYKDRRIREKWWIHKYDACNPKSGYNAQGIKRPVYTIQSGKPPILADANSKLLKDDDANGS